MNTASRMETNSEPGRINLSNAARRALFDQAPCVQARSRGEVPIKGKTDPDHCWWLVDSDENRSRCARLRLPASRCVGEVGGGGQLNLRTSPGGAPTGASPRRRRRRSDSPTSARHSLRFYRCAPRTPGDSRASSRS